VTEFWISADPLQDIEAIFQWHFDIENGEAGDLWEKSFSKYWRAFAISDDLAQRSFQEKNHVLVVFCDQDWMTVWDSVSAVVALGRHVFQGARAGKTQLLGGGNLQLNKLSKTWAYMRSMAELGTGDPSA